MRKLNIVYNILKIFLFSTLNLRINLFNAIFYVTWRCNAACLQCDLGKSTSNKKELSLEEINELAEELKKFGCKYVSLSGGEPLMRNDIVEIIKVFKDKKFIVGMSTNGFLINYDLAKKLAESGIDHIHISLDAPDEIHDEIRNVKDAFKKVDNALKLLIEQKRNHSFYLGIGTVISGFNFRKIDAVFEYARKLNLDGVSLQPILYQQIRKKELLDKFKISDKDLLELGIIIENLIKNYRHLLPRLRNSQFFIKKIPTYFDDPRMPKMVCFAGKTMIQILPDGEISCCIFLESVGNTKDNSLGEILHSQRYRKVLTKIKNKKCPGCWCPNIHEYNVFFHPFELISLLISTHAFLKKY